LTLFFNIHHGETIKLSMFMFLAQIYQDTCVAIGYQAAQRKAEGLGNDNRKTMIKVKNYRLNTAFQKRHGFAQSISSAWLWPFS